MYSNVGDLTWTSAMSGLATKTVAAGRGRWNSVPLPTSSTIGGPVGRMLVGTTCVAGGGGVAVGAAAEEDGSTSAALTATHSISAEAAAVMARRLRITIP